MSVISTEITLTNDVDTCNVEMGYIKKDEIRQMTVQAIVDTGAWTLVINEDIRQKLGLLERGFGEANLADGQKAEYPMAGPVEIRWKNRRMVSEALVLPDASPTFQVGADVLLGAMVLEHMDLTINPKRELVGVHGDREIHRV